MSDPQHRTSPHRGVRRVSRRATAVVAGTLGAALALTGCTPPATEAPADPDYTLTQENESMSPDGASVCAVSS